MKLVAGWFVFCSLTALAPFAFTGATRPVESRVGPPAPSAPVDAGTASPTPQPPGPAILDVTVSPNPLRAGKPLFVSVHTTPDVTSIEGRVLAFRFSVPKTGDQLFSASTRVPWWARLYHGRFRITFIGSDASGTQTQATELVRI